MSDTTKKQRQFLLELRTLTQKHGIAIGGCGCCSSPWLTMDAPAAADAERVEEGEPFAWVVPDFGFLFPFREAATRYLENIGSEALPTPLYTHSVATPTPMPPGTPVIADAELLDQIQAQQETIRTLTAQAEKALSNTVVDALELGCNIERSCMDGHWSLVAPDGRSWLHKQLPTIATIVLAEMGGRAATLDPEMQAIVDHNRAVGSRSEP